MNLNKIQLIGRVGKDPEVRTLESGKVASFSLATTEKFKDKEQTEWHSIACFGNTATVAESYVHKGDLLYIEGRINTREWTDKDGNKRHTTQVIANTLGFLSPKKEAEPPAGIYEKTGKLEKPIDKEQIQDDTPGDDLPF